MITPDRYREVSVTDVDVPLLAGPLRALLGSRPVYRRTRYMVVRSAGQAAVVEIVTASAGPTAPLFSDVLDVVLLATPAQTAYVVAPDLDPGVPSDLALAAQRAPDARCVVLEGRWGHVSFVLDPAPVRLHVLDVAPPRPAKLIDQVRRLLMTAEDLPPVLPLPQVVEYDDLLGQRPSAGHYLLPCRGGTVEVAGAQVSYLDEVPPQADWTLVGCARSRAIHDWFYGPDVPQIDTCPRTLADRVDLGPGEVLLTKCCLLEDHVEVDDRRVVVPWGAAYAHIGAALELAVRLTRGAATPELP